MPKQLVVIVGAGASHDSTREHPFEDAWRPPLATQLFESRPAFTSILALYPDAQSLAPDLRAAVRTGAIGLEEYLRDHVLSPSAYDRRRYRAIPLYLQHVLWSVGMNFTPHPANYDRLINAALRHADEVVFITLNYDTLLDSRLAIHTPIRNLSDYLNREGPWCLLKLHGSVDWMKEILNPIPEYDELLAVSMAQLGDQELEFNPTIRLRQMEIASTRRGLDPDSEGRVEERFYYPALSVPLGPEDELNCPPDHREYVQGRLAATGGLHILTVGYSGLDAGVLDLLRDTESELRSLYVVNENGTAAMDAAMRICATLDAEAGAEMAFPQTLNDFVWTGALEDYMERLPSS